MYSRIRVVLLAAVVAAAACDGSYPGDVLPPMTSGPASNQLFDPDQAEQEELEAAGERVCAKLLACQERIIDRPTLGFLDQCAALMGRSLALVIDLEQFMSCFEQLPCSALSSSTALMTCARISTTACVGDSLQVCDDSGLCKDVDCRDLCDGALEPGAPACAASQEVGIAACTCSLDDNIDL